MRADACLRYGVPGHKSLTILNPVDVAAVRKESFGPPPHPWLTRGVSHRNVTLVTVGRLVAVKDFGTVLRAIALVPEARLLVVGDGPERSMLEAECARLGIGDRVCFLGHQTNTAPYVRYADALVSSSLWEGFGLTVVEAAAVDTYVLASDVPALNELVPARIHGALFTGGDEHSLASAIRQVPRTDGPAVDLAEFETAFVGRKYLEALRMAVGYVAE